MMSASSSPVPGASSVVSFMERLSSMGRGQRR
jgi:hypothetical protein